MPSSRPDSQAARARAFGARIRELRRERGLTQRALAVEMPMSSGNLSRIETGYQGPPSDETIERLAAVLEVDVAELLAVAGRSLDREAFEQRVLKELRALRVELRAGLGRIETALEQGPERR